MKLLIVLGFIAASLPTLATPATDWDQINWKQLQTNLKSTLSEDTSAQSLAGGNSSPGEEDTARAIGRLKAALRNGTLICTNSDSTHALSLSVVKTDQGDVVRLQSNYGYGTPSLSELNVNSNLTSFYFGEEPNDIVMFNTDLDWDNQADGHPKSCSGFSFAALSNTGDIGIGSWGLKSETALCCIVK